MSHQIWPNWRWKAEKRGCPLYIRCTTPDWSKKAWEVCSSTVCACNCCRKAQCCLVSEPTDVVNISNIQHHLIQEIQWQSNHLPGGGPSVPLKALVSRLLTVFWFGIECSSPNRQTLHYHEIFIDSVKEVVESAPHAQNWCFWWILLAFGDTVHVMMFLC